jgi:hypothetical protein
VSSLFAGQEYDDGGDFVWIRQFTSDNLLPDRLNLFWRGVTFDFTSADKLPAKAQGSLSR